MIICRATPDKEVQAQNLRNLQSRWRERHARQGTHCDIANAPLWSPALDASLTALVDLVECDYLTDPEDTPDMYELDKNGKWRCKRGTNGVESGHRTQHSAIVGTTMKPETFHLNLVNHNARALLRVRGVLGGEYKSYPTSSHDLLHDHNQAKLRLNKFANAKRGLEPIFTGLSVPNRKITAADFDGGTKNKSLIQKGEASAKAAAAAAPFIAPATATAAAGAPATALGRDVAADGSGPSAMTQTAGPSSPFREQHGRAAAEGVNKAVQAERGNKRQRKEASTPTKSPKKPRTGASSPKSPVGNWMPPNPKISEHAETLRSLLAQAPFDKKTVLLPKDYELLTDRWNAVVTKRHSENVDTALVYTNKVMLKAFHEEVHIKWQALTRARHPEVRPEDAGPSEAQAESNIGSNDGNALQQVVVAAGRKLLQATLSLSGNWTASTTAVAQKEEKKSGRGAPGQRRFCCACAWRLKKLVPMSGHKNCPHQADFQKLHLSKDKASQFVKDLKDRSERGRGGGN